MSNHNVQGSEGLQRGCRYQGYNLAHLTEKRWWASHLTLASTANPEGGSWGHPQFSAMSSAEQNVQNASQEAEVWFRARTFILVSMRYSMSPPPKRNF